MEITLLPNGLRDRSFRPMIHEEELGTTVYLYDPNGSGFNYGLYATNGQATCGPWISIYNQYPSRVPAAYVNRYGRQQMIQPNLKQKYGSLFKNMVV